MKIIKYILYTILTLVVIVLVLGLIVPKTFHAGSQTVINRPIEEVFDYVKILENQKNYDAWSRKDEHIKQFYEGNPGTVGSQYRWESDKVGNGKQIITAIEPYNKIEIDIYFYDDDKPNKTVFEFQEIHSNQTQVKWYIDGEMPYPLNVMGLFFNMDDDFVSGLENLKNVLEN